ncbi:MAG: M3 family oligoendopeptidase [Desulfomonilaceae bacterium]|nr:M3 family oligoendopeptidase [Desulfomonilaceae bacterium]
MFQSLPADATGLGNWTWKEIEPYYLDLLKRPIHDDNVGRWLADWTRLSELLEETFSRLHVATTVNTADKEAEEAYHRLLDEVYPPSEEAEQRLKTRLLESYTEPPGFEIPLLKMRTEAEIFHRENLPLLVEEHKLTTRYDKILGAQTVEWEGEERTIAQMRPLYQLTDRSLRESAWRLAAERQLEDREAINDLWRVFLDVRRDLAGNAGFGDYRSFRWKQMLRFDYTPEDCRRFHEAIERTVVPAAIRICERRRTLLGLEMLRPWDMDVDPYSRPPLAPFNEAAELVTKTSTIFHYVDPVLGGYFDTMAREGLLDLENRKNKAPGGYCTEFAAAQRPFIFMNAVGVHDDVQTLLHESGHAFHTFERSRLPYIQQRQVGMEFAEVASMAMELLASPYLSEEKGGLYSKSDADRAVTQHLEWCILFWPFMAVVDAFQHWVYENPSDALIASNCDERWASLWERFVPWIDWTGLEPEKMTGWHRKLHIHVGPFYYVEYGLAQLGAAQIWRNALKDRKGAVKSYRRALALGGTVGLPELYSAAGAEFSFDAGTLGSAVSLMEHALEGLYRGSE